MTAYAKRYARIANPSQPSEAIVQILERGRWKGSKVFDLTTEQGKRDAVAYAQKEHADFSAISSIYSSTHS